MTDFAAEFKKLQERYDEADKKLDATLEAITVSNYTPVILIGFYHRGVCSGRLVGMMPFGLIASAAIGIGKRLLGHHLVTGGILSTPHAVENAVSGLGWRFFVGGGTVLYFTQPTVRAAIDNLVKAVTKVIL